MSISDESQAVVTMRNWLLDAVDKQEPVINMQVVYKKAVVWPLSQVAQDAYLIRFELQNGFVGIGLVGPVTWCFLGEVALDKLDYDLLLLLYLGWYIMFVVQAEQAYEGPRKFSAKLPIYQHLQALGYSQLSEVDSLIIEDSIYYEVRAVLNNQEHRLVIQDDEFILIEESELPNTIPALYYILGQQYLIKLNT